MSAITKPTEGAPDNDRLPGGGALVGTDGNAYSVMATVSRILKRAGASPAYVEAYMEQAMSGDYDHLLATSLAFVTPEGDDMGGDEQWGDEDEDDEEFTFGDAMALRFG